MVHNKRTSVIRRKALITDRRRISSQSQCTIQIPIRCTLTLLRHCLTNHTKHHARRQLLPGRSSTHVPISPSQQTHRIGHRNDGILCPANQHQTWPCDPFSSSKSRAESESAFHFHDAAQSQVCPAQVRMLSVSRTQCQRHVDHTQSLVE